MAREQIELQPAPFPYRVLVEVPWESAERARIRLAEAGVPATLLLDASEHVAALEVPLGVDLDALRRALSAADQAV